ncbi:Putative AC transposase [Linum grandiflorum]
MKGQMRLDFQQGSGLEITNWKYDPVKLRQKIAIMIILDELPFRFVEKEGFRGVMKEASPLFKMPCRKTIRADCLRLFLDGIVNLKSFFKSNCIGRVSITTDCWTSIQNFNYICITAHFVGVDWKLHRKIINFCRILSHKGVDIADVVGDCLEKWGLRNICSVTVDNASANDTAIQCLKEKFFTWGTNMLQGKYLHMRCVAHVTNLIVGQGLSELGMSVRRVREAVRFVRSSPARFARFEECIVFSHIESTKTVSLDVPTRWNSTFLMLESAIPFEAAFKRLEDDLTAKSYDNQIIGPPQHEDWVSVRKLLPFLGAFYDLTLVVSGTKYVTIHLFMIEILKIFTHIRTMQECGDESISCMADKMLEKMVKYWDDSDENNPKLNRLCYIASVFDPRQKMFLPKFIFTKLYGEERAEVMIQELKDDIAEMFKIYQDKHDSTTLSSQQSSGSVVSTPPTPTPTPTHTSRLSTADVLSGYIDDINVSSSQKTDLDIYLSIGREDCKYDILLWWKNNGHRHPLLCEMVRDIFGVPISSVSSESAFSTGGRILDSFRSSLTPSIVEALICSGDWLRSSNSSLLPDEEDLDELAEIEKGNFYLLFHFALTHHCSLSINSSLLSFSVS